MPDRGVIHKRSDVINPSIGCANLTKATDRVFRVWAAETLNPSQRRGGARRPEGITMVEAAEDRGRSQLTGCRWSCRRQPVRACGRLGMQAAMWSAVVVAEVFAQDALSVAFAEDQNVVEAVATERPHETLAYCVPQRCSGRRGKAFHPEATEPPPEARVIDAVAVVQQIAWRRVTDGLDHALPLNPTPRTPCAPF